MNWLPKNGMLNFRRGPKSDFQKGFHNFPNWELACAWHGGAAKIKVKHGVLTNMQIVPDERKT